MVAPIPELERPNFVLRAARMWAWGYDTQAIAFRLGVAEADVYARIDLIKTAARRRPMAGLDLDALGINTRGPA